MVFSACLLFPSIWAASDGSSPFSTGVGPTLLGYSMQGAAKYGLYEYFKKTYADLAGPENAIKYKDAIFLAGSASAEFFADMALVPVRPSLLSNAAHRTRGELRPTRARADACAPSNRWRPSRSACRPPSLLSPPVSSPESTPSSPRMVLERAFPLRSM